MITCRFESGRDAALRHAVTDNIVLRGEEVLLVRRSQRLLEGGKWALVGGFVERDETLPEGAAREILEETGYRVRDLILLRIIDRPDRPGEDRQNISFVHFCTATEKAGAADDESDEQRWFPLDNLPRRLNSPSIISRAWSSFAPIAANRSACRFMGPRSAERWFGTRQSDPTRRCR